MDEKIFHVIMVARQIDGEYVFIRSEKAFKDSDRANNFMQTLKDQYMKDGKTVPVMLMTPHGDIPCNCEIGIFEVKIEN